MSGNGWIKLHRKLCGKGYYKKSQYVHLWVHLLLKANHKPNEFMWNKEIIMIKEGQLLTGRKELSKETGISQTTIERILEMLESEHQIGQQKTTKFRVITILNWKEYQTVDIKTDNKRTTNGQQTDTNKNDKNGKNDKNIEFELFWDLYDKKTSREKCLSKFSKLSADNIKAIMDYVPKYKLSTPDKKYRKNPETFLNNKSWNDELIGEQPKGKMYIMNGGHEYEVSKDYTVIDNGNRVNLTEEQKAKCYYKN